MFKQKRIKIPLMIRPITKYGDRVLRTRAEKVTDITADVQALIDDMIETMYAAPGVGSVYLFGFLSPTLRPDAELVTYWS